MHYTYTPHGVCSRKMEFDVENGKVYRLKVTGGCNGNLKGISALVEGMNIEDVIDKLSGIRCGFKDTSCPGQLALALKEYKKETGE